MCPSDFQRHKDSWNSCREVVVITAEEVLLSEVLPCDHCVHPHLTMVWPLNQSEWAKLQCSSVFFQLFRRAMVAQSGSALTRLQLTPFTLGVTFYNPFPPAEPSRPEQPSTQTACSPKQCASSITPDTSNPVSHFDLLYNIMCTLLYYSFLPLLRCTPSLAYV